MTARASDPARRAWRVVLACTVSAFSAPAASAAHAAERQAQRGQIQAVLVKDAPPIDGVGEGGSWAACPPQPLGRCTDESPAALKTAARIVFDATRLYVAWQCEEPLTDELKADATQRDGDVWEDDCVELFITGDRREGFCHFAVNPKAVVYDARRAGGSSRYDTAYNPPVEVKAAVQKDKGWSITLAVPLKDLGAYVGEGQTWTANLNRTRPGRGGKGMMEWSWAVMSSNDYHQVNDYGQIAGVAVPKRADGVARQAAPPPPPVAYNKGEQAGSVVVYHRAAGLESRDTGAGLAHTIDLAIRGAKGLKVAFLASATGGVESIPLNMYDRRANDNTTSKAYRWLHGGRWRPAVYFCDQFRYNSAPESTVAAATDYANLRFHGPTPGGKGTVHVRNLVIYRGEDTDPPAAPAKLRAVSEGARLALSWGAAADNTGVATYVISRAGPDGRFEKIGESPEPTFIAEPPTVDPYRYRVLAADFQDNLSPWSQEVACPTAKGNQPPRAGVLESDRQAYAPRIRTVHAAGRGKVSKGVVLCFGDSLTGATSYGREIEGALGRYRVVARGYPSMKTSFGRGRIAQELEEINPEFCLAMFGTNNGKGEKDIPPAVEDMTALAETCAARGTVPVIGTIPPRGFADPNSKPEARYNAALIEMCRREHIPIAYNFEAFQAHGNRRELIAGDGVHTHEKGFATFARSWAATMDQVLFVVLDRADGDGASPAPPSAPASANPPSPPSAPPNSQFAIRNPQLVAAPAAAAWPPPGAPQRVKVTRDNWTSTVQDERFGNNGGANRLKLKGQQEHAIFDIDAEALRGKLITGALLHIRSASPSAPLLRVTVSTLAAPWVEGTNGGYRRQEGSSCFDQSELGKRDWAYPGSTLMDVAFGRGHTIWRFAEASPPDEQGWQAVAVEADVVAARAAGLAHGLAAYDDVGSIWSYKGGKFEYTYFPNRFIHSRESRGSEPYLEVWTNGMDGTPPGAVADIAAEAAGLPAGEALVTWTTPADAGGGRTLGFHVSYEAGGKKAQVPRYLIPMAGGAGKPVRMHIQDLPLPPGQEVSLTIAAVDSAGNVGPAVTKTIRVSDAPRAMAIADGPWAPFPPSESLPAVGGLKVAVLDLLDKVNPKTGAMVPPQPAGYKGGNHLWSAARKLVRLAAARNEAVCFQVNLAGSAARAGLSLEFPGEAGLKPRVYRLDCVGTSAGVLPDVAVPLAGEFAVPFADDPEAAGAANVSLLCEVFVPHDAAASLKRGKLTVAGGAERLQIDVELTVWDFTLPNKLSFIPEMNCYGTADPKGGLAYYRLAHEHRLCLNRLYYGWSGSPGLAPKWMGDRFDFAEWDRLFGPLLDGSAFKDLPRAGEPVDVFYLPFNENWPADVYAHYRPSYWIESAFAPPYAEALKKAFADFAAHSSDRKWHDTILEFYLNNKVYYKTGGWKRSSAPWIFDEPVNTQDFWALRWYGQLWQEAVAPVRGQAKLWYRNDISRSQCGREMLWGAMELECMGGADDQKVRMKRDEQVLWGRSYFTEYGSANDPAAANLQPVLWSLKAWADGAMGVLPWQTIGKAENLRKGEATGLFIPLGDQIVPSVRLKAFRRGQQDVEYLTLLGEAYGAPQFAVAGGLKQRIDLAGQLRKTSEADAGEMRFERSSPTALWQLRTAAGAMVAARKPAYRRVLRDLAPPQTGPDRLPDIGYVRVAPPLPPSKPDMD